VPIGERLKYARQRTGLTLRQVVERTGIGESSLSEYENDKREPRLSQLQALAEAYRRSIAFFLGEGGIPREIVLWRKRPDPPTGADIEAEFVKLCEQYHNLEVWCADRRPCILPVAQGDPSSFGYAEAERLAYRVQSELRLGDRPGRSLFPVLEEVCGVKLFYLSFQPSGTGASTVSETFGSAVLLNTENVRWRRNFDLAHELFHLLTWPIFRDGGNSVVASEGEEKLATCFASRLLMPTDATRLAINEVQKDGSLSFSDLFDIARQFDVSVEALLWRIHFLYNRNEEDTRKDITRYNAVASVFEDREPDKPPRRPARYVALAVKAFRNGEVSQGKFAEYLGISRREALRYAGQEALTDEEVALPPA
jgi:Zn-dependent peptidase ImmA (M78 family)/transcriptional regulator with XRE-family HTH domain